MEYQALLFDLDGTLTASGEGITKCVQYALEKLNKKELAQDLKKLEVFVGPPLLEQFMAYAGLSEEEAEEAVKYYRERYLPVGIFENRPYEGIEEVLKKLKKKGYILAVASSKPDSMVKTVLNHFSLSAYFQVIKGSDITKPKMTKAEVIEEVLEELGFSQKRGSAIMIGDRHHDVSGAKTAGISCIGVTYGYGDFQELQQAGAVKIVDSTKELGELFGA